MADDYIILPLETDPAVLEQDAYDALQVLEPDWTPHDGNLDVWIIAVITQLASEQRDVATDVPTSIFRYFGAKVLGLPPIDATPASGATTWTMVDNAGYTIPAGTVVSMLAAGDTPVTFQTLADVIVPPGSTATGAGAVTIQATDDSTGAVGTALGGAVTLVDTLAFVSSIAIVGTTSGGVDAETDDAYLNRLVRRTRLMAPRPILPDDFSQMALDVTGVVRATAIDGWDPGLGTGGHDRTISVAAIDAVGAGVSAPIKSAIDAYLQANREANFLVYVIDPTSHLIDVTFTAKAATGYDTTDVHDRAVAAVTAYLSPANWGADPVGEQPRWTNNATVRYTELIAVVAAVDGVDYVASLTFREHAGVLGTSDVVMSGAAPLPTPNTISGTIT